VLEHAEEVEEDNSEESEESRWIVIMVSIYLSPYKHISPWSLLNVGRNTISRS
jgi:hypothetical protein